LPEAFGNPPAASEAPSKFLELQLPRWAYRFTEDFRCRSYFDDPGRAKLLFRLVDLRAKAELALSTDRRGLPWIKPLLKRGDWARRLIQDRLFGMPARGQGPEPERPLAAVNKAYDDAQANIDRFHEARNAWEEAANELPYLAEWAIRSRARSRDTSTLPPDSLPDAVPCKCSGATSI
jgi:hypothetical protein